LKYKEFFGMNYEPFRTDLATKELLDLPGTKGLKERVDYALSIQGICIVTGEVGVGKSTALRAAVESLHPSHVEVVSITANSGALTEMYSMIGLELGLDLKGGKKAKMAHVIRAKVSEISGQKKKKILFTIDEAQLLRKDVLMELHTLAQFAFDSKALFSMVLCGQNNLIENLQNPMSAPLASRVVTKHLFTPLKQSSTDEYIHHHTKVAGLRNPLFDSEAIVAVHQASSGILRRINNLARGAILSAYRQQSQIVQSEHVRLAATEII
jgi:general secretion pathway protein A